MGNLIPGNTNQGLGSDTAYWKHAYIGDDGIIFSSIGRGNTLEQLGLSGVHGDTLSSDNVSTIYLSARTDGVEGDGSYYNPYDVSTATKLDNLIRPYFLSGITNITFIFHSGIYQTYGAGDTTPNNYTEQGTYGFSLLDGWKFIGAGIDKTIIKSIDNSLTNGSVLRCLGGSSIGIKNILINNLTVDANLPSLTTSTPLSKSCIYIHASGECDLTNLKLINCGTNIGDAAAGIYMQANGHVANKLYMDKIYVDNISGYGIGIIFSANNATTHDSGFFGDIGSTQGSISRFYIKGNNIFHGIDVYGISNINIYDGIIEDCGSAGLWNDVAYNRSIKVNNVLFNNCAKGAQLGGGYTGQHINTSINNCTFIIPQNGYGIDLRGNIFNSDFSNNFFIAKSGTTSAYGINTYTGLAYAEKYKNNTFYFNKFDPILDNFISLRDSAGNIASKAGFNINFDGFPASGIEAKSANDFFTVDSNNNLLMI